MAEQTFQNNEDHSSTGALPLGWTAETVAVVTGANRGIGYEIVRKLAMEGMTVVLTARDEGRGLKATADLHAANLKNVVFHKLDVANPDSVTEFAKWLKETYNGLDVLVNNAAITAQSHIYDKALEGMNINYFGTINLTEKLLPLFKESAAKARIINMSSLGGFLVFQRCHLVYFIWLSPIETHKAEELKHLPPQICDNFLGLGILVLQERLLECIKRLAGVDLDASLGSVQL